VCWIEKSWEKSILRKQKLDSSIIHQTDQTFLSYAIPPSSLSLSVLSFSRFLSDFPFLLFSGSCLFISFRLFSPPPLFSFLFCFHCFLYFPFSRSRRKRLVADLLTQLRVDLSFYTSMFERLSKERRITSRYLH
jgi:hypothetical protein